jgi:protein SCO1/2
MAERILMLVAGLLAGLIIGVGLFWQPEMPERPLPRAVIAAGGDFTLQSAKGAVSLKDYRGKLVLVYFGYTFCPDVCPTSLATAAEALAALTPDEAARVRGIFVSVDPERDTMEILKAYAPFFHPSITGASGTPDQVAEVARRYGVSYMKQKSVDGRPYTVDHSSFTYLVAPDGRLATALPHGTPAPEVLAAIRRSLGEAARN